MGSREYRLDHSIGPFDHLKLDHLLNNVKMKGHFFVFVMSQPVKSIIKAQRTAHLRAASLHLGLTFATSLLRTLCGLQRRVQSLEGGTPADLSGVLQSLKFSPK